MVPNSTCNWSWSNFCKKDAKNLTRNKLWWKLSKFDLFLLCKVQKMTIQQLFSLNKKCLGYMVFIINFQFQVHLTWLSVSQMAQSPMPTKLDLERRGMVQNKIFLFWTYHFEYKHLLSGAVLIYLTVCANSPPLRYVYIYIARKNFFLLQPTAQELSSALKVFPQIFYPSMPWKVINFQVRYSLC